MMEIEAHFQEALGTIMRNISKPSCSILSISFLFSVIDNAVLSVPASMNDENLDEEEGCGGGRAQLYCLTHPR